MSRKCLLVVVILLALTVGAAHAEFFFGTSARNLGMGDTGIAGADDVAALDYNPANLGVMDLYTNGTPERYWTPKTEELDRKLLTGQFIGSGSAGGNADLASGYVGALIMDEIHKKAGFSVSWKNYNDLTSNPVDPPQAEMITFGYGHEFFWDPWTWGFSFSHKRVQAPYDDTRNSLQLGGLLWGREKGLDPAKNWRLGLVIQDAFNFSGGPYLNVGGSYPVLANLRVNVDYRDLFDQEAATMNVGAEWAPHPDWRVRLGDINVLRQQDVADAVTAGLGWSWKRWNADIAYISVPEGGDPQWVASGSYKF